MRVASEDSTSIVGDHQGSPFAPDGATLSLHSVRMPPPESWATVTGVIPADSFRNQLVTITADVVTENAPEGAALWMRIDGSSGFMAFWNTSTDEPVTGTASKTLSITLHAYRQSVSILFGMILTGSGKAEARHFRLTFAPAPTGPPAPAVKQLLDSVYAAVRQGSYWRDTITWNSVEPEYWAMADGLRTTDDAYPTIRWLLSRLGDHHSNVMSPAAMKAMNTPQTQVGGRVAGISADVKSLDEGIGYVMVPAFGSIDSAMGNAFAVDLRAGLVSVDSAARCGWVVDLRNNGGGNMWPMLAGLKPLLGGGVLGYFRGNSGENSTPWPAGLGYPEVPDSLASLGSAPVAVLTGPRTGSSGEAVTIAFRGRPRTRSFGLATAGLANANAAILLPDGGMLSLMNAVDVDRDGHVYGYKVDPDVIVPDGAPGTDPALDVATRWLKAESRCE